MEHSLLKVNNDGVQGGRGCLVAVKLISNYWMRPGNFYLVVSGIREIFLVESGILGFGIRNPAQLMGYKHDTCNPESITWNPESPVWNPESKTVLLGFGRCRSRRVLSLLNTLRDLYNSSYHTKAESNNYFLIH